MNNHIKFDLTDIFHLKYRIDWSEINVHLCIYMHNINYNKQLSKYLFLLPTIKQKKKKN